MKDITALDMAVDAHDCMRDMHGEMMMEIGGEASFHPYNEELAAAVFKLISTSAHAVAELSDRARRARLNLIWQTFVAEQRGAKPHGPETTRS
jgi:hypothetical protein